MHKNYFNKIEKSWILYQNYLFLLKKKKKKTGVYNTLLYIHVILRMISKSKRAEVIKEKHENVYFRPLFFIIQLGAYNSNLLRTC